MNTESPNNPPSVSTAVEDAPAWHSRGYLPHFEGAETVQHVTFHLADSLPNEVLGRLDEEAREFPLDRRAIEFRRKVEAWIDAGHGSCRLREPPAADIVQSALLFFDADRYRLMAWTIMPNHVHALFQPLPGWTMAQIVASWKKFTARRISAGSPPGNADLQIGSGSGAGPQIGSSGRADLEIGVPGKTASRFWHREYWDRYIRNERHFRQAVQYIHENPVKAGLATKAEDWRWSSAFRDEDAT